MAAGRHGAFLRRCRMADESLHSSETTRWAMGEQTTWLTTVLENCGIAPTASCGGRREAIDRAGHGEHPDAQKACHPGNVG